MADLEADLTSFELDAEGNIQPRVTPWAVPEREDVLLGVPVRDTTGTYIPSGGASNSDTPYIAVVPLDASALVTVLDAAAGVPVQVRVRHRTGEWLDASPGLLRLGSGSITVPGLANGCEWEVSAYTLRDGFPSRWAPPVRVVPEQDAATSGRGRALVHQRDQIARAHLEVSRRLGAPVIYTDEHSTAYHCMAIINRGRMSVGLLGNRLDDDPLTIEIARQGNFPPARIIPGNTITVAGTVYAVQDVESHAATIDLESVFVFTCDRVRSTGALV